MALTLNINNTEYAFRFGFAFLREINPLHRQMVEELNEYEEIGFQIEVLKWLNNDFTGLVNILWYANKTEKPRIEKKDIEEWIENMTIEEFNDVSDKVKDFLSETVLCSKTLETVSQRVTEMNEEQTAKNQ